MFDVTFYDLNLFGVFLLLTLMVVIVSKQQKYTLRGRLFRLLMMKSIPKNKYQNTWHQH